MQINSSHHFQVMSYCHGGKVLSSGGRGMGSPFTLPTKDMPGSLPRSVCTVDARKDKHLSWQVYFSIFVHAASSFVLPFFSWLFLPLPLFLPYDLSCLSPAAFPRLFRRFPVALLSHISSCSSKKNTRGFLFGAWKSPRVCVARLDI